MLRAFEISMQGIGHVSPNPLVGCVIVKNDKVIGEGWHRVYGEAHAEVNAINNVADKQDLEGAELFVTLEPCAHYGKTPPCAALIVQFPFKRVVIANVDPNPLVSGKGTSIIRASGIEVTEGVLADLGKFTNRRFFTYIGHKRPYVILKWAETADGYIAREDNTSKWISGPLARKLVHKWRSEEDAIMVGRKTAACDNPRLNVRDWSGRDPVRILLDPQLSLGVDLALFDNSQKTIVYNYNKDDTEGMTTYVRLDKEQALIPQLLNDLYEKKIQSLLVEGGSRLHDSFLEAGLWDEIRHFRSRSSFGSGIAAPKAQGKLLDIERVGDDELLMYTRK